MDIDNPFENHKTRKDSNHVELQKKKYKTIKVREEDYKIFKRLAFFHEKTIGEIAKDAAALVEKYYKENK